MAIWDEKVFGRSKFYKNGNFVTGGIKEKFLFSIFVILGGMFFGLGFYKMQPATQDPYQVIVTIAIFLILGSVFMQKLIKGISVATSKMFKTKYSSSN